MKTFEAILTIETSECMTVDNVCQCIKDNNTLLELDLPEGKVTNIEVSEIEFE